MFSARSKYDAVIQRTDSGHDSVQNTIPSRDIRSQEGGQRTVILIETR